MNEEKLKLYSKGQMTLANAVMYFVTFFFVAVMAIPIIDQSIEQIMIPSITNNSTGTVSPMSDITVLFARFIPVVFITAILVSALRSATPIFEGDSRNR